MAFRLHVGRLGERFTQAELAPEIGTTRSALAKYESSRMGVSWSVALAWARRLDCNLRWLATGAEPQHPFVSPEEMGADVSELNGVESLWFFSNAYKKFVHDAAEKWHKKNSQQDLVMRHLRGGPAPVMRRLSWKALLVKLREFSEMIEKPSSDSQLAGAVANLSAAMDEIKHRVRGKYPHLSKLL